MFRTLPFPLLTLALMTLGCDPQGDFDPAAFEAGIAQQAIVRGEPEDEVGATVALTDALGPLCTGTLIAPRVVLTAAHCVVEYDDQGVPTTTAVAPGSFEIAHGLTDANAAPPASRLGVDAIFVHDQWDPDAWDMGEAFDMAVVTLSAPAPVSPAPLLSEAELDAAFVPGGPLLLAGYGQLAETNYDDYGVLYRGDSSFVARTGAEFQAGSGQDADTCYGDSGGPVYVVLDGVRHVVGVTSRGVGFECGDGGIYGLVNEVLPWIDEVTGDLFPAGPNPSGPVDEPGGEPADEPDEPEDEPIDEPGDERPVSEPERPVPPEAPADDDEGGLDIGAEAANEGERGTIILEQGCSAAGFGGGGWIALGVAAALGRRRRR